MKKAMKQSQLITILNSVSVALLALLITFIILYMLQGFRIDKILQTGFEITISQNQFMMSSRLLTENVRAFSATEDEKYYKAYQDEIDSKNREKAMERITESGATKAEIHLLEEMLQYSGELVPFEMQAIELAREGNYPDALKIVYGDDYVGKVNNIIAASGKLKELFEAREKEIVSQATFRINLYRTLMIISAALVAFMQFVNIFIVKKKIIQPILAVKNH